MTLMGEKLPALKSSESAAENEHMKRLNETTHKNRAIVIGAGIGGLLAARVLAEHYREVIVI
jgi:NADPH-dependent 2,4-dienoyl-CoA reductase/sulfur reductase-like enzyme